MTTEQRVFGYADFKDGAGIEDPNNPNSRCTHLLFGERGEAPEATWSEDQNMGDNHDAGVAGLSNGVPPLVPVPGHPTQGGINLGLPCPLDGSPPSFGGSDLWLVWSGENFHFAETDSSTRINLCTQQTFVSSSPGCLALSDSNLHLIASACTEWQAATFSADYLDAKGKGHNGQPYDLERLKSDRISCSTRHSHDYTGTVQSFGSGGAAQTFDQIKNESIVHTGRGSTYMAVCWQVDYQDYTNPLAPVLKTADTHDWKLILDVGDSQSDIAAAIQNHYGPGSNAGGFGGSTQGMQGFYSDSSTGAGQNGFGPCPTSAAAPEPEKPEPVV